MAYFIARCNVLWFCCFIVAKHKPLVLIRPKKIKTELSAIISFYDLIDFYLNESYWT